MVIGALHLRLATKPSSAANAPKSVSARLAMPPSHDTDYTAGIGQDIPNPKSP